MTFVIMSQWLSKWVGTMPLDIKLRFMLNPGGSGLYLKAAGPKTNDDFLILFLWFIMGKSLITGNMRYIFPLIKYFFGLKR